MPVEIAPRNYLAPFFAHLQRNEPWTGDKEFFRGALFEDGRMDLCKQVVGPTHIEELCRSVNGNSHIRHFLLGNNIAFDRHPERAASMAELMSDNSLQIETWYLAGNCINPKAIQILANALMDNKVAKALWLKRNPIGWAGAFSLRDLISHNRTLTILDLDNCGLLDDRIAVLCEARGCVLKHLYVDAGLPRQTMNPTGLGIGGFGNLGGYTLDQVKEVPILSAGESLEYFDQVYGALNDYLTNLNMGVSEQSPIGWPSTAGASPERVYVVLLMFLMDIREHLGEIKAIKAMWKRKCEKLSLQSV